jgi:signal transduction histidine kinase
VHVDYGHDAVDIRVVDDGGRGDPGGRAPGGRACRDHGTGSNGGHGIVGMTERAQMFGGTLSTRRVGDGFEVHAHLPTNRSHR